MLLYYCLNTVLLKLKEQKLSLAQIVLYPFYILSSGNYVQCTCFRPVLYSLQVTSNDFFSLHVIPLLLIVFYAYNCTGKIPAFIEMSNSARAGNSLIGFLSEWLVFLQKNERMSVSLKKTSDLLIHSFLVSDLSDSLMVAYFW